MADSFRHQLINDIVDFIQGSKSRGQYLRGKAKKNLEGIRRDLFACFRIGPYHTFDLLADRPILQESDTQKLKTLIGEQMSRADESQVVRSLPLSFTAVFQK